MSTNILQPYGKVDAQMPERIATSRLVLRKPELIHAEGFARGMGNRAVSRNTASFPIHVPTLSGEFWVFRARANFARGLAYAYIISPTESDDVAGVMEIFTNRAGHREIGYWIARDQWGNGYATEAGRAVIDTLVTALGVSHIEGGVYVDNPGSCRVLEKLGFKHMGVAPRLFSVSRGCADDGDRFVWTAP